MGQDYIFYDAMLYGTDKTGNKLGFDIRIGKYEKPIFRKRIDARSDEIISHEIEAKETIYEIEYTPELFDSLLEQSIEEAIFGCIWSFATRTIFVIRRISFSIV